MARYEDSRLGDDRYVKARALVATLKKRHWSAAVHDPNIVGMAYGRRHAHGRQTDEPALVVYVVNKTPQEFVPMSRLLPRRMYVGSDCVEVDVVETGVLYPLSFTARERPALQGLSISHLAVTAGTLGASVIDNTDNSNCILSNNHVIANQNAAAVGDPIVQPGTFDGGTSPADDIAALKRFVTINATGNRVDAAIAQIAAPGGVPTVADQVKNNLMPIASAEHLAVGLLFAGGCSRTIMNPIADVLTQVNVSFPAGAGSITAATIGMNVEKVGRTTEYTTSTVKEIDATVTIAYDFGDAQFDGQITTGWMSSGGDSGSLICQGGAGGDVDKCGCGTSTAAETLLGVDLREERVMSEVVRDKFLRETRIGEFVVDLFFENEDRLLDRFNRTSVEEDDIAYARKLFGKHRELAHELFAQGERSEERVTQQHMRDARSALKRAQKYMSKDEIDASERLFALAREHAVGKQTRELLALLNDERLLEEVREITAKVRFVRPPQEPC